MREMKDSGIAWIGEIPKDWEVVKIKHLADINQQDSFIDGDWIESPYITDNGIRYLTTGNIGDGVYKHQGNGYISLETFNELNCKYAYPNDLVFSRLNSPYGRSCILPTIEDRYVIAVDNVILRTQQDKRYICFLTQCSGYQDKVEDGAKGTTMKRISRTNLGNVQVCLPSLSEQHLIANFLDEKCGEIDELVALQEKMIDELKAYKQSVITETVTKGLNPNVKMKDSGVDWIGDIPEHWGIERLKNIVDKMEKGAGITKDEVFANGDTPCVRYGEIYSKYNYAFTSCCSSTKKTILNSLRYFNYGDLLCAGTGELVEEIGKTITYLGHYECLAGGDIIVIKHHQIPLFLSFALNCHWAQAQKSCNKAKLKVVHISASDIGNVIIAVPPLSEQHSIATYLDEKCSEIDSLISIKQKKIEALKDYKKSLIYEYVTGKKQVG